MSIVSRALSVFSGSTAVAGQRSAPSLWDRLAGRQPAVYPALSGTSRIPHYRDPSALQRYPDQAKLRSIVRHLVRTDARVQSILETKLEIVVGDGPRPKSRYKELDDLFLASATTCELDNRGERNWGQIVDDIARLVFVDGEAFIRVRDRMDRPFWSDIQVPVQFQVLPCEMVDAGYEGPYGNGLRFVNGVVSHNDRKLAFATWTDHPQDGWRFGREPRLVMIPTTEMFQVLRGGHGAIRGEVPLAAAIIPAEDLADLNEADIQLRKNATIMATYFEAPPEKDDAGGVVGTEDDERSTMEETVRNLQLRPGDNLLLPPGYKANMQSPVGNAPGHELSVKTLTMTICAVAGVPYFDAMGDWKEAPERAMRYAGAALKRRVVRERAVLENLALNRMWRAFVDVAMITGKWRPPAGASLDEIYRVTWRWPVVQQAALDRELTVVLSMVKAGLVPPSQMLQDYFGWELEDAARQWSEDAARLRTLGIRTFDLEYNPEGDVASRIAAAVEAEEAYERDLVDASKLDVSVMKSKVN